MLLANTHSQTLKNHSFAVGYLAYAFFDFLGIEHKSLATSAFWGGVLHDIGKIDPNFQSWLHTKIGDLPLDDDGVHIDNAKFSFDKHPRHHEISWLLAQSLLRSNHQLNSSQVEQVLHAVYYHHTKPFRKNSKFFDTGTGIEKLFLKSLDSGIDAVMTDIKNLIDEIRGMVSDYRLGHLSIDLNYDYASNAHLPNYKIYSNVSDSLKEFHDEACVNGMNNLVRMAVIMADRIVSGLSADELQARINEKSLNGLLSTYAQSDNGLSSKIQQCLDGFNTRYPNNHRNQIQATTAKKLADMSIVAQIEKLDNIAVLQGVAGCGKTKISLEWALNTKAKKIIWVCPRVQVCLGILEDLTQSDYLANSRIEIFTGEFKKILHGSSLEQTEDTHPSQYFTGDIVITTIDQVVNNIVSHQKIVGMVDFMQSHVVFDEFHELISLPTFNLFFSELIEAKKLQKDKANTLLVSATPNYLFVNQVLGIKDNRIVTAQNFNTSDYLVEFALYDDANPMLTTPAPTEKTTFFISNMAQTAQIGFITHQDSENAILIHSKYTKGDKAHLFGSVFDCFKQGGNGCYQVLRSSPIVQCSLNISCDRMFTDITTPENWLQRLGRLDRFGLSDSVNVYTTFVPSNGKHSQAFFLSNIHAWRSSTAWHKFVMGYLAKHGDTVKLATLYECYDAFYKDKTSLSHVEHDLIKSLEASVELINKKVADPISVPTKNGKKGTPRIAKVSLRGDSVFVQCATAHIDRDFTINYGNDYAYDENTDHTTVNIGLTESVNRILGGGMDKRDSNKDLLAFMHKKHHQIKGGKASRFDWQLLQLARSSTDPIYLSYSACELEKANCPPHSYAIYYVKTDKQVIGMMNLSILFGR